jgi:hypothetical protein
MLCINARANRIFSLLFFYHTIWLYTANNTTLTHICCGGVYTLFVHVCYTGGMPTKLKKRKNDREELESLLNDKPVNMPIVPTKGVEKAKLAEPVGGGGGGGGVAFSTREAEIRKMVDDLDQIIAQIPDKPPTHKDRLDYMKYKGVLLDLEPKKENATIHINNINLDELSTHELLERLQQVKLRKQSIDITPLN